MGSPPHPSRALSGTVRYGADSRSPGKNLRHFQGVGGLTVPGRGLRRSETPGPYGRPSG